MSHHQMLACFFPTQVILIDDDSKTLQSVPLDLETRFTICRTFDDSRKFLKFFHDEYKADIFTKHCLKWLDEEEFDHRIIDINLRQIHREIYNSNRFNQISVIISDYAMPGLNGVELFKQIKNSSVKKILLTGKADENLAVKAFNEGIIDKFIRKDDPHFSEVINQEILLLQRQYFDDLSALIVNSLTQDPRRKSCLNDPVFIRLFQELVDKHRFAEYYLMDETGSFLFLNAQGKPSWLSIKSEADMDYCYELATDCDESISSEIVNAIENREKVPYFHTDQDLQASPTTWERYLYPATKLQGRETYYYALIQDTDVYDVTPEDILSYKTYLNQLVE